jgi:hypothetical protein
VKAAVALVLAASAVSASGACSVPAEPFPTIENRVDGPESSGLVIGYPNSPITERSLAEFLSWRFARQLGEGTFEAGYNDTQEDVIDELDTMGLRTIHELAAIIPADFEILGAGEFIIDDPANIPGLVRDFMMIHDADRYFEHAWKNRWQSILPANVSALRAYVRDFSPFYDAGVLTPEEVEDAPDAARGRR